MCAGMIRARPTATGAAEPSGQKELLLRSGGVDPALTPSGIPRCSSLRSISSRCPATQLHGSGSLSSLNTGGRSHMKNRMSFTPSQSPQNPRSLEASRCGLTPGDQVRAEDATAELSEAWRTWETENSARFFNGLVLGPHGTPKAAAPVLEEDWICFQKHSSTLDRRAMEKIGRKVPLLQSNPTIRIVIGGIAHQPGPVAYGMRLGLRRVQSIRSCLLAHKVDPERVEIAVRGRNWFLTDRAGTSLDLNDRRGEYRLQVTDSCWTLARN
ncbi:MAG: hypothetical protein EA351_01510 [Gemmatimonadales bacterium]|nr:MAG: hypothetical protein EA351_01510 [Gemmatimonadales bacterium]